MNIEIDKKIEAYLKGQLSTSEIDGLWADILANPEYLGHLKTEAQLKAYFSKRMAGQYTDRDVQFRKSVIVSIAAVLVVAVGIIWTLFQETEILLPPPINTISVFDMETPVVTRSENETLAESALILLEGYDLVLDGDETEAVMRFRDVIENYPESESATFGRLNLGVIAYNNHDYEEAQRMFESAAARPGTDEMILQKALWFMANAALQTGDLETAAEASKKAGLLNGYYSEQATGLSDRLNLLRDPSN
ncbi:MAG: tetratricopeptide repeat protein [Cyclonatronaceae bacterium]